MLHTCDAHERLHTLNVMKLILDYSCLNKQPEDHGLYYLQSSQLSGHMISNYVVLTSMRRQYNLIMTACVCWKQCFET